MHGEHQRAGADQRDRREIPDRVVGQLLVEGRVDRVAARDQRDRVAVRSRPRHDFRSHDAVGARAVLDDHLLPQALAELGRDDAADRVVPAAGREQRNDPHRLRRVRLLGDRGDGDRQQQGESRETPRLEGASEASKVESNDHKPSHYEGETEF
jgi:hypothetical protein